MRKEFYNKVTNRVRAARAAMNAHAAEIREKEDRIRSDKYSPEYKGKLRQEITALERQIQEEQYTCTRDIEKMLPQMKESLEAELEWRAEDMVKDLDLLKFNPPAEELVKLVQRHNTNPTAVKIILNHAKERGLTLPLKFSANIEEYEMLDALTGRYSPAAVATRQYYSTKAFEELLGEDSTFAQVFNTEDRSFSYRDRPSVISISDDRVANAIRLMTESNTGLSVYAQESLINDFKDSPAALEILKDTARKTLNFVAEALAAELLDGHEKSDNK